MIGLFEVGLMRGRDLGKCFKSWVCRFLINRSRGRRPRRGLRQPATSPKEGRQISMLQVGHLSQLGWGRTSFYIMQDVQQGWRRVNIQYFDIKVGGETCLNPSNSTWNIEKWCHVLRVPLFLEQKYQTFKPKLWDEYNAVFAIIGFRLEKLNMLSTSCFLACS